MQSYIIKENFIASESQKVFKLRKPFIEGTINVYVNEALQSFGPELDYTTLPDKGVVIFTRDLNTEDKVTVETKENTAKVLSYGKRDTLPRPRAPHTRHSCGRYKSAGCAHSFRGC